MMPKYYMLNYGNYIWTLCLKGTNVKQSLLAEEPSKRVGDGLWNSYRVICVRNVKTVIIVRVKRTTPRINERDLR